METLSPRIRLLMRQANKVAESGKRSAATKLYKQVIEEAPETVDAWIGLASVYRDSDEKEAALDKALELDPGNAKATRQLAILHGEIVDEPEIVEADEIPVQTQLNEPETLNAGELAFSTVDTIPAVVQANSQTVEFQHVHESGDASLLDEDEHDLEYVDEVLYCANHPKRETHLRCNRCSKPICTSCAQRTPVGYRCPQCIREQEEKYYSATIIDYLLAVLIALPLSLIAGYLATLVGFFVIFLAAAAGSLIGRLVFRAVGRRRGRWMPQLVGVIVVMGGILPVASSLIVFGSFGLSIGLLWSGIYVVMATGAAYYQMR